MQTAEARRLTAYHESGHALVALNTPGATPIHKATIVPRGHALGMVSWLPHEDEYSVSKQQMLASIDVCMGGKAAEELIFGEDQVRAPLGHGVTWTGPRGFVLETKEPVRRSLLGQLEICGWRPRGPGTW